LLEICSAFHSETAGKLCKFNNKNGISSQKQPNTTSSRQIKQDKNFTPNPIEG